MSNPPPKHETTTADSPAPPKPKLPFYRVLWVQVLFAIALAIVLGYVSPARAIAMKPLGDAFIRLISMIITLVIFCTVVLGITGAGDMLCRVVARTNADLQRVLDSIVSTEGVVRSATLISLATQVRYRVLPLVRAAASGGRPRRR